MHQTTTDPKTGKVLCAASGTHVGYKGYYESCPECGKKLAPHYKTGNLRKHTPAKAAS